MRGPGPFRLVGRTRYNVYRDSDLRKMTLSWLGASHGQMRNLRE